VKTLVCLLEEPSSKEMLKIVLSKILSDDVEVKFIVFEGKQDLEKQIERKIRYWKYPNSLFLVMRDQDSGDCFFIKKGLIDKIKRTGKADYSIVRIACHELESFYLGDLEAVELGLDIPGLSRKQNSRKFRNPGSLSNASEELAKLTRGKYHKILGSRVIAPYLKLDATNKSISFQALLSGVKKLINRD